MAVSLILEFDGLDLDSYRAVNQQLGIDPETGEGDWPAGMVYHAGSAKSDGLVVFEVWESQADQASFMENRLGPALGRAGVNKPPSRVEWMELGAYRTPGS